MIQALSPSQNSVDVDFMNLDLPLPPFLGAYTMLAALLKGMVRVYHIKSTDEPPSLDPEDKTWMELYKSCCGQILETLLEYFEPRPLVVPLGRRVCIFLWSLQIGEEDFKCPSKLDTNA